MEEVRELSMAYYSNLSEKQQKKAMKFFKKLDGNGDGMVSLQEFLDFLKKKGHTRHVPQSLFQLIDKNLDGSLDFWECVTLYYMLEVRGVKLCGGCGGYLLGTHFICVKCYEGSSTTYDLCYACYRSKNYKHKHTFFLDNYALLRHENKNQSSSHENLTGVLAAEIGSSIGSAAASGCSIM